MSFTIVFNASRGSPTFTAGTATFTATDGTNTTFTSTDRPTILTGFGYNPNLVSITNIPDSVTSVSFVAFDGCSGLTSIVLPNSITRIGSFAFRNTQLSSITLPTSLATLDNNVFEGTNITTLNLPNTLTSTYGLGNGMNNLTSFNVNNTHTSLSSANGVLYNKNFTTLYQYPPGKTDYSFIIPNTVTTIYDSAFQYSKLRRIIIPNSVTSINDIAFQYSNLESVTIPNSVTTMGGNNNFSQCPNLVNINFSNSRTYINNNMCLNNSNLKYINIPSGVTRIGNGTFQNCSSLTGVTIPNTVTEIGNYVFAGCANLADISIPSSVVNLYSESFNGLPSTTVIHTSPLNDTNPVWNYFNTNFPNNTITNTDYNANAFTLTYSTSKESSTLFNGNFVATDNTYTKYVAPSSYRPTEISESQFYQSNLIAIENIPDSVTSIGSNSLQFNGGLTSVLLPDSVTYIGAAAFYGCNLLTKIYLPPNLTIIGEQALAECPNLNVSIPNSVTSIGNDCFHNNNVITTINLGSAYSDNNFTNSFQYMYQLQSINIDPLNPNFSSSNGFIFSNTYNLVYRPANATSLTLPAGYSNTNLGETFQSNQNLVIHIDPSSNVFSEENNIIYNQSKTICYYCGNKNLSTAVVLPNTVTSIDDYAFYYCNNIPSITLSNILTTIGLRAFQSCLSLITLNIPDTVTSIGAIAFYGCNNLTKVTIPYSSALSSIPSSCFEQCNKLNTIQLPNSITSIDSSSFTNISLPVNILTTPLNNSNYVYTYFNTNFTPSQISLKEFSPLPVLPCFKSDTKILTINGYVPIQDLRKGDLVKTINHEFVPINMIGCKTITNSKDEIPPNKLFVCSNENYPEITEDLYITGLHSILVDELSQEEESNLFELFGKKFVTDNKYRLPVFMDKRANLYEESGEYTIYHIALDHEHELMNYGIYANGLLVETCCIKYLKEHSNMDLIE
jgi:hypothetical protein